jgi:hypothetical protein
MDGKFLVKLFFRRGLRRATGDPQHATRNLHEPRRRGNIKVMIFHLYFWLFRF